MTRTEAIKILSECKEKGFKYTFYTLDEYHTAMDIAINSLQIDEQYDLAMEQADKELGYGFGQKIEPCGDVISREMALKECHDIVVDGERYRVIQEETLLGLPPVNPQEPKYCDRNICVSNEYNGIGCDECEVTKSQEQKTGHWIYTEYHTWCCSECGGNPHKGTGFVPNKDGMKMRWKYCNLCGAKMVEPQESEAV